MTTIPSSIHILSKVNELISSEINKLIEEKYNRYALLEETYQIMTSLPSFKLLQQDTRPLQEDVNIVPVDVNRLDKQFVSLQTQLNKLSELIQLRDEEKLTTNVIKLEPPDIKLENTSVNKRCNDKNVKKIELDDDQDDIEIIVKTNIELEIIEVEPSGLYQSECLLCGNKYTKEETDEQAIIYNQHRKYRDYPSYEILVLDIIMKQPQVAQKCPILKDIVCANCCYEDISSSDTMDFTLRKEEEESCQKEHEETDTSDSEEETDNEEEECADDEEEKEK